MSLWIIHAFIALTGFSGIYIFIKAILQQGISPTTINFYFFTLTGIGFLFLALIEKENLKIQQNSWWLFLGLIVAALVGNYFSLRAFAAAPNPGYSQAIVSGALVVLTLVSYFIFGSDISALKFLGILLTISGIALISIF